MVTAMRGKIENFCVGDSEGEILAWQNTLLVPLVVGF